MSKAKNPEDALSPRDEKAESINERLVDALESLTEIQKHQAIPQIPMGRDTHPTPWHPSGARGRERLKRRVFMNGHAISDSRLSDSEVKGFNQLKHGKYKGGKWIVMDSSDNGTSTLHLYIPNKTMSDRMEMPRSLGEILTTILDEQKRPILTD